MLISTHPDSCNNYRKPQISLPGVINQALINAAYATIVATAISKTCLSSLIQTILSVPDSHRINCVCSSRTFRHHLFDKTGITVGREFKSAIPASYHPAPKNSLFFLHSYCMHLIKFCQYLINTFHTFRIKCHSIPLAHVPLL